jgi:hypothetical protein
LETLNEKAKAHGFCDWCWSRNEHNCKECKWIEDSSYDEGGIPSNYTSSVSEKYEEDFSLELNLDLTAEGDFVLSDGIDWSKVDTVE